MAGAGGTHICDRHSASNKGCQLKEASACNRSKQQGYQAQCAHCCVLHAPAAGVYGVAKMLGLYQPPDTYFYMDNMTRSASKALTPPPSAVRAGRHLAAVLAAQGIHWKYMAAHVCGRPAERQQPWPSACVCCSREGAVLNCVGCCWCRPVMSPCLYCSLLPG